MKNGKFFKILVTLLSLLTVACIVSTVMLFINGPKTDLSDGNNQDPDENNKPSSAVLQESADFGDYYLNNMIFVGDKTVSAMKTAEVLKDGADTKQIWCGKDGDLALDFNLSSAHIVFPHTGEEMSIPDAAKEIKPDCMIITVGINNGLRCSEEKFNEYYGKLITAIREASPDTKIILQSVFPVSKDYEKTNSSVKRDKIEQANQWILKLAESHGVKYLDTASVLKDSKGYLKQEYDSGNGITLNSAGYTAVLTYVRTHGYK